MAVTILQEIRQSAGGSRALAASATRSRDERPGLRRHGVSGILSVPARIDLVSALVGSHGSTHGSCTHWVAHDK